LPILLDAAHPQLYIPDLPSDKPSIIGRECELNEVVIVILPENLAVDAQLDTTNAFPMLCPELIFTFLLLSPKLIFIPEAAGPCQGGFEGFWRCRGRA